MGRIPSEPSEPRDPCTALTRLASVVGKERKQLCVINCVDDMHTLQHENGNRTGHTSEFFVALNALRVLANASDAFVTVLLATERSQQMMDFHYYSTQQTRYLQTAFLLPPTVNGRSVFVELTASLEDCGGDAALPQLLIGDMGGHAKALEILLLVIQKCKNEAFAFVLMLKDVLMALQDAFPAIRDHVEAMKKAFRAVLTRQIMYTNSCFGDLLLDDVLACGLIRRRGDRLESPFVLYLLLETQGAPWYSRDSNKVMVSADKRWEDLLEPRQPWEQFSRAFQELRAKALAEDDSEPLSLGLTLRRYPRHKPKSSSIKKEYYGPFAARANFLKVIPPLCSNTSSQTQLRLVDGVGKKRSATIMKERPFADYKDAHEKTRVPVEILKRLRVTRRAHVSG